MLDAINQVAVSHHVAFNVDAKKRVDEVYDEYEHAFTPSIVKVGPSGV